MMHKRSTALERSMKYSLEGLNRFHGDNLTFNSDVDQDPLKLQIIFGQKLNSNRISKRPAESLIRLYVCAGWYEGWVVSHTLFLEIHVVAYLLYGDALSGDKMSCIKILKLLVV